MTESESAARWLDSGLLDVDFYAALRGRDFGSPVEAAADFVRHGMPGRLSPHPRLDFVSLTGPARRSWRRGEVAGLLKALSDGPPGSMRPVGPLAELDDGAARAVLSDTVAALGREARGEARPVAPVDWSTLETSRGDGVTALVVAGAVRSTARLVDGLLRRSGEQPLDVVVFDVGTPARVALGLRAALHGRDAVRLVRHPPGTGQVPALEHAVAQTGSEVLVLLDPRTEVRRGWLREVRTVLADPDVAAVQPLLLSPDDMVAAPVATLHPKEDAWAWEGRKVAALAPDAVALRRADVVAVGGLAGDLGGRLAQLRTGGLRVAPLGLVTTHRGEDAALGLGSPIVWPNALAAPSPVHLSAPARSGALRWSLKLPSSTGHWGDDWGDTHFAEALARALRRQGQQVVTVRRGAHTSGPTHLDDVALAFRGMYPVQPVPGVVNAVWVISHPDEVGVDELAGFDVVCAASTRFSADLERRLGREVVSLLQATEFAAPHEIPPATDPSIVFVGNNPDDRERPLVWLAVEAEVPLAVYGRGWDGLLPAGVWRGEYVDNASLPTLYRSHGIVLADHWPAMAGHGFIANRVFDALASGARVISDDVAGIQDVVHDTDLAVARSEADIVAAVERWSNEGLSPTVARVPWSFDDRARTLLSLVASS